MYYDKVLQGGTCINPEKGTIAPANIGILDGKIAAISTAPLVGKEIWQVAGHYVCPGFIDVHCHIDGKDVYTVETSVKQGVTTVLGGHCGLGTEDVAGFFKQCAMDAGKYPLSQGIFIGHSFTLRERVGITDRYTPATEVQIEAMVSMAKEGLEAGAMGVSFGLEYAPGSSREEVKALCELVAQYGRWVTVHTRYDADRYGESIEEMVEIAKETGVKVVISHLAYMFAYGQMKAVVDLLKQARMAGVEIVADSGMYTEFCTGIGSAVFDDGFLEKFGIGYGDLIFTGGPYSGERATEATFNEVRSQSSNNIEDGLIALVGFETEIDHAFEFEYTMVSSDGGVSATKDSIVHPQDAGTFPKFFNRLVNHLGQMDWLGAVRRCTLLPAQVFNLPQKGRLAIGADADLVVFHPEQIKDSAQLPTFGLVDGSPIGIPFVLAGGAMVVEHGVYHPKRSCGKGLKAK